MSFTSTMMSPAIRPALAAGPFSSTLVMNTPSGIWPSWAAREEAFTSAMDTPRRGLPVRSLAGSAACSASSGAMALTSPDSTLSISGFTALTGMHMPMPSTDAPE